MVESDIPTESRQTKGAVQETSPPETSYRSPSNAIAIASLLVAIIALIVSLHGHHVADQAHTLAKRQYKEERWIVLTGDFNEEGDAVVVRSTDESITFQFGYAHFPTAISNNKWYIRPNDKTLYLKVARFKVAKIFAQTMPKKEGSYQISDESKLPLFIDSSYTSHGQRYLDRSLYALAIHVIQTDENSTQPRVKFTGLEFIERYTDNWPTQEVLDSFFVANTDTTFRRSYQNRTVS